ncbi:tetratricopeptide repeat protein, partial [Nocardia sp. NPDC049526]|uniref:tetratricopeptide repeat protein n=1 Tax=Nocardia sp. NPDC049526 TaxID=3364316 RepID=UPI003791D536
MGGRLALVVGSECETLRRLGFADRLASDLADRLSALGGWESAVSSGGALLNPTTAELVSAVKAAFTTASEQQAALLISFIGHGVVTGDGNFFLLAHDSPTMPESDTALHLVQVLSEQLDRHPVDGLIVMIDACETREGLTSGSQRLTERTALGAKRIELLVATGNENAYDGCFTRTTLSVFEHGLPARGENLLPLDLLDPLTSGCPRQVPGHWGVAHGGDPGLWLVPNVARRDDAVRGRSTAGLVDQLTEGVVLTDSLRQRIFEVVGDTGSRLRVVIGPAGCGKSTLMSLLIRPGLLGKAWFSPDYVAAAAFVSAATSLESLAVELSEQLRRRVDEFADATSIASTSAADGSEVDVFESMVLEPLARIPTRWQPINIVIDGLDQAESGTRDLILAALTKLVGGDELEHVKLLVGIREGDGLEDQPLFTGIHHIQIPAPTLEEIARVADAAHDVASRALDDTVSDWQRWITRLQGQSDVGGWLLARLLTELDSDDALEIRGGITLSELVAKRVRQALHTTDTAASRPIPALLAVLTAAGSGPVLPVELLHAALTALGHTVTDGGLRDSVVALGMLISRGNPGTPEERLGLAHEEFLTPIAAEVDRLGTSVIDAHQAITTALENVAGDRSVTYARGAGARHYLACGEPDAALNLLTAFDTPRPADNRDTWASWLPLINQTLGPGHPDNLVARHHLACWRGESGDIAGAIIELERLLADSLRFLGPDHPSTLTSRGNLAYWRGDIRAAITEYERLLADNLRVLGPDHPNTFATRHNLAYWRSESGDIRAAITEHKRLLVDRLRALGPDHPDTLTTRHNVAYWLGESGDIPAAITEYERLLVDRLRALGPDHPDTLTTRHNLASCRGQSGDIDGAITEFEHLLVDRLRVLGPDHADHPDTLTTRHNLAYWRGQSGDIDGAITEFEHLLVDRLRVLGPDHPDTFATRGNLAYWRGENGDISAAITEHERLLVDRLRVLGPDHPDTFATAGILAYWRGESGDISAAITEHERLLVDRLRVLGPDHPNTLTARNNLAYWRGQSGDIAAAIIECERSLTDSLRVLGPDHPHTLTTRHNLASLRGQSGDIDGAIIEHERLLTDNLRVLGPDHPNTLTTRNNLAYWRGQGGDIAAAIAEYKRLLTDNLRILGPDHLDTLAARHNAAYWRSASGDIEGAITEFERLLVDRLRVLGPDHPNTLTTRNNLAHWRGQTGDIEGAITEFERLLVDRLRVLGPDHPNTLTTRNNLAHW